MLLILSNSALHMRREQVYNIIVHHIQGQHQLIQPIEYHRQSIPTRQTSLYRLLRAYQSKLAVLYQIEEFTHEACSLLCFFVRKGVYIRFYGQIGSLTWASNRQYFQNICNRFVCTPIFSVQTKQMIQRYSKMFQCLCNEFRYDFSSRFCFVKQR